MSSRDESICPVNNKASFEVFPEYCGGFKIKGVIGWVMTNQCEKFWLCKYERIIMNEQSYAVVWPRGNSIEKQSHLAKRLDTLEGKSIGFMWNGVFFGDKMASVVKKELGKRYPRSKFTIFEVFQITHGKGDVAKVIASSPDKFKQYNCDAVISGVGC